MRSKSAINTLEWPYWLDSGIAVVNFEHIQHIN